MPFKDADGKRYFTDDAVERWFSISASKLRTAQRYELIESLTALHHQRHIRVWPEPKVMLAYVAQMASEHLGIPFQVACRICVAAIRALPDYAALEELFVSRKLPKRSIAGGGRTKFPMIVITDRKFVGVAFEGFTRPLGCLDVGEDGRIAFRSDQRIKTPGDGRAVSRNTMDCLVVVKNFVTLVDTS